MKGSSQSNYFLFHLCPHFLILKVAQGCAILFHNSRPLSMLFYLHPPYSCFCLGNAYSFFKTQPNVTSSLKALLEPSFLNQIIVNFIISNTSKHSGNSLNISVIFYNPFSLTLIKNRPDLIFSLKWNFVLLVIQKVLIQCLLYSK